MSLIVISAILTGIFFICTQPNLSTGEKVVFIVGFVALWPLTGSIGLLLVILFLFMTLAHFVTELFK